MAKREINFIAELPSLLSNQVEYKRVRLDLWNTLPENKRTRWHSHGNCYTYYQIILIPPYINSAIGRLAIKLRRQRVKFTKTLVGRNGVAFIIFSTIGVPQ